MRVLVIGGTKFLGPFVVEELLRRGHQVALFHRRQAQLEWAGSVAQIYGEAKDAKALSVAAEQVGAEALVDLVHCCREEAAAVAAAMQGRLQRSVHVSCASVYAPEALAPVLEEAPTVGSGGREGAGVDALAKAQADEVVLEAAQAGRLSAVVVRLAPAYGPRSTRPLEWFLVKRALEGRLRIALPDGGVELWHRGFVQNLAFGIGQALERSRIVGEVFNLGDERAPTLRQLTEMIGEALGHRWEIFSVPGQRWRFPPSGLRRGPALLDLHKAKEKLRYRDLIKARDALEITVAWVCQNRERVERACQGEGWFDYAAEEAVIAAHGVALGG